MNCPYCGASYMPEDIFCGQCGCNLQGVVNPPVIPLAPTPLFPSDCDLGGASVATKRAKKKKGKGLKITLSITALVLVVALIAGLLTNWFGLNGPAVQIINAAKKTLDSGSFRLSLNSSYSYGSQGGQEIANGITYDITIDYEKRDLTLVQLNDDNTVSYAIYQGYQIRAYDGLYGRHYSASDISEEIDQLFDLYESTGKFNLEDLLNSIDDDAYNRMAEVMDMDELESSIMKVGGNFNNEWWLKNHAGYSKETSGNVTTHIFAPQDLYALSSEVLEEFEDAFKDEDDYEQLQNQLSEQEDVLQDLDLKLAFTAEDGYLSDIALSMKNQSVSVNLSIGFEHIGSIEIDTDGLEQILASAQVI